MAEKLGLTNHDRKELEGLVKAAARDARTPIGLARKAIPTQGNIEEFAYGLISGMVIGNFMARFENENGRQPDRDEMVEIFAIMRVKMPLMRKSIMKQLDLI